MVLTKEETDIKNYLDSLKSVHEQSLTRHEQRAIKIQRIFMNLRIQVAERILSIDAEAKTFGLSYKEKNLFGKDKITRKELKQIIGNNSQEQ